MFQYEIIDEPETDEKIADCHLLLSLRMFALKEIMIQLNISLQY